MISKELQKKIELIKLSVGKKVTESFTGNYESAFKGQGIEFDEVKEYIPGDDYRAIDWNVTARTGVPHIKRYTEERELSILFAIDVSASSKFIGMGKSRLEMAAEVTTALALAASRSNDKTGLLLFSDKIEKFLPPTKGNQHTMRLIREVMGIEATTHATNIGHALSYISEMTKKRWTIFLISDFYDFDSSWLNYYRSLRQRFDLIPIRPTSKADYQLPNAGLIHLNDPETGKIQLIDSSSARVRNNFMKLYQTYENKLQKEFLKAGTKMLRLDMDQDWTHQLISFFVEREQRGGHA